MSRRRLALMWSAALGLLLLPALALASEAGVHATGINWWATDPHQPALGWLLVDFAIFVALLVAFARRPLREFVRTRALGIRRAIEEAAAQRAAAERTAAELAQRLTDLDRELKALREDIVRSGERERAQLQADAERTAERMQREVGQQTESELARVKDELHAESMRRAIEVAEQTLRARLTAADHQRLNRQFVDAFTGSQGVLPS
ncbi:MAG: hypothetical protein JXR83_02820 [Deltaproteobacteria bacterium]|nr:hypothetical protein [Deltaproteobacteria bacterium]